MLELFANPQFLVAGGALVSAPIIIHLINRMRFKRIRWAAMEFLLKSQKRNRRKLIIEQLILLGLRCLLVLLVGFLVSRFIGLSLAFGILADAFLVRLTLVPAVMALLGRRAWWMPKRVERLVPNLDIESEKLAHGTA